MTEANSGYSGAATNSGRMNEPSQTPRTDAALFSVPIAGGNHAVVFASLAYSLECELAEAALRLTDVARGLAGEQAGRHAGQVQVRGLCDEIKRLSAALTDEALVSEIAMQLRPYEPIGQEKVLEMLDDIRQGIAIYLDVHARGEAP